MKKLGDLFRRKDPEGRRDSARALFGRKLSAFQRLLEENNAALAAMADLEEKRTGEFLFDRAYLSTTFGALSAGVRRMIESLQDLTDGRYAGLSESQRAIDERIAQALHGPRIDLDGPVILRLDQISAANAHLAGGKMAHLGRLSSDLALPVPEGFVITAAAFARFMAETGVLARVRERLGAVRIDALEEIERASAEIRAMIVGADLPSELGGAIRGAVDALAVSTTSGGLAVRSSAVGEDGDFSFAGQYATFLNVSAEEVEGRYREVVASLFTPRAIFYYRTKGFAEEEMAMAVGVMRMVDARAGGVIYTRDPLDPEREVMVINGVWGLGTRVVDGAAHTDIFTVARGSGEIVDRRIADKDTRETLGPGGLHAEPVEEHARAAPCLSDSQAAELARHGAALEAHFGPPQDIEWALDAVGRLWILQSRPLQLVAAPAVRGVPRRVPGRRLLIERGIVACKGIGSGPVAIVRTDAEASAFPAGAVLVARTTSTALAAALPRAAALVTDVGSAAGHLASLAREYRVPALLDTGLATAVLQHGSEVTVDAFHGNVYEGRVEELLGYAAARPEVLEGAPLLQALGRALEHVTPLHLTDPASEDFRPEACRTLHDLTRFAHEKAMNEMFNLAEGSDGGAEAAAMSAGIPVAIHVLDIDGGLAAHERKVAPEAVLSVPFAAFLKGMREMTWPEPRPADVGGLLGMMAHTATMPEEELYRIAEKSLALIGANYMNFSIRLGYHFSQVEAWVGERLNDNYIRFFFKGGGAVRDRRLRRVRLIAEILGRMDFRVQLADDVIRASVAKFRRPELERTLTALGKLTAYTKQLDMAMFNDGVTDWYRDEFVREHLGGGQPLQGAPEAR